MRSASLALPFSSRALASSRGVSPEWVARDVGSLVSLIEVGARGGTWDGAWELVEVAWPNAAEAESANEKTKPPSKRGSIIGRGWKLADTANDSTEMAIT